MTSRMRLPFTNDNQRQTCAALLAELSAIGYSGDLLVEDYRFGDWFVQDVPERTVHIAAFGQLPPSYDTACLAVVLANGQSGESWISQYRSLGAPYLFEVRNREVVKWSLEARRVREDMTFGVDSIPRIFHEHASDWSRVSVLRAKNIIAPAPGSGRQLNLFLDTGLIPAIEQEIQARLDPLLKSALSSAVATYHETTKRDPDPTALFQLAFRLLAGKVFFDRGVPRLRNLGPSPDPDSIINAVADIYGERPRLFLTKAAREALYERLWTRFDFRNLSIEVLTMIWSGTFVTPDIRKRLGIHPTRRAVARYIVNRLPFDQVCQNDRVVVEPCAGSGTFLVAALHRLRDLLPPDTTARSRHAYLRKRLLGFEQEPFGVEIGTLSLTLADFPNPNGWQLIQENVFASQRFIDSLTKARFVVCNPPFEAFPDDEVMRQVGARYHPQPAELLSRILDHLHRDGAIGFVLPNTALDGQEYKDVRARIAQRFSNVEIVSLPPESAFETARHPAALLIAYGKKARSRQCAVVHRKVHNCNWLEFVRNFRASREDTEQKTDLDALKSLLVPDLAEVWKALQYCKRLSQVADVHRGIEWNKPLRKDGEETGNRERLVKDKPMSGFRLGIPPKAKPFYAFRLPPTAYLSIRKEHQLYRAVDLPWDKPKVFLNAVRKSHTAWRLAAVADFAGLLCYQTFTAIWPRDPMMTIPLAAILNGPVANAFLATHEIKHNRNTTVGQIPVPRLIDRDISRLVYLVDQYQRTTNDVSSDMILRHIDAAILSAYDLAPRLERQLLDYFNGSRRQIPFPFAEYYPADFEPCFSLHDYMSPDFEQNTAGELRKRFRPPSEHVLRSLKTAAEAFES